jgi:hypothetical protein
MGTIQGSRFFLRPLVEKFAFLHKPTFRCQAVVHWLV